MKALSIRQPYATWIAEGRKTIESRTWGAKHRGPLLICASRQLDVCAAERETKRVTAHPLGQAVAVVDLKDCRPMRAEDAGPAMAPYAAGKFAWVLDDARVIEPFGVVGQLGLFEVDTACSSCGGDGFEDYGVPCIQCGASGSRVRPLSTRA